MSQVDRMSKSLYSAGREGKTTLNMQKYNNTLDLANCLVLFGFKADVNKV